MKAVAPFLPYVATFVGIHVLSNAWVAVLLYQGLAVAFIVVTHRAGPPAERPPRVATRLLSIALVIGAALGGVALYLVWDVARIPGVDIQARVAALGLSGAAWWGFVAYFITLHPVIEEMFWRRALASSGVVGDVLFGGYHAVVLVLFLKWPFVVAACLVTAAAGWAWRAGAQTSLRLVIASHAVADVGIVLAAAALGVR